MNDHQVWAMTICSKVLRVRTIDRPIADEIRQAFIKGVCDLYKYDYEKLKDIGTCDHTWFEIFTEVAKYKEN